MALSYLSDDEVGKDKKKKDKKKKDKKGGGLKQKVKKVAVAPARVAFLSVVTLNGLRLGTKLARVWKQPAGKTKLLAAWTKLGGDVSKLKNAVSKGSKETLSGNMEEVGIALEAALATAIPIILIMAPLIKEFKAGGDAQEMADFDAGVNGARGDFESDPSFESGYADMKGANVALLPKNVTGKPSQQTKGGGGSPSEGSMFSPLGICFKTPLLISLMNLQNPILVMLAAIISGYCVIGLLVVPFYELNFFGWKKYVAWYFDYPKTIFSRFSNSLKALFNHGKEIKFTS